ncbi:MAG: hypothetical protein D6693_07615 [Planctomycetota bacterium]|nr:MAG: hypothetical protein D6693_07615 [Planctomycetota bacterium]
MTITRRRLSRLGLSLRPRTPNQLHAWLRLALDVDCPRAPIAEGSDAPFDYLAHAFFESSTPRDALVWANRGGGKTYLGAVATALDLAFKPGVEVRILAGSLEQAARMHQHLRELMARPVLAPAVDGRPTERRVRLLNGSTCRTLAQSHASVRGVRVQKLRCDEVELFDPALWDAAQLTTRSKRCGETLVRGAVEALSTMHRPHGLMAKLVDESRDHPGARRLFRWGVVDTLARCEPERPCGPCDLAPECAGRAKAARGFLPIEDALALKRRAGADAWASEMLCERPSRADAVYPEFDRAAHVISADPPADAGGRWLAGMDFGFRAPTVILFAHAADDGALRIVDEISRREVVLDEHARSILESPWPAPVWVGVDPAGRQRSEQTGLSAATALRRAGLAVRDRRLPVAEGIALVRARLAPATGGPRLFVHARCRTLIESLEAYRYPADRPESAEPVKDGADHAADALRYLVVNLDRPHTVRAARYA